MRAVARARVTESENFGGDLLCYYACGCVRVRGDLLCANQLVQDYARGRKNA